MGQESQGHNNVIILFCLSGLLGFFLGTLHATWQASVEIAQVIAGVVKYSSQSPLYLCHTKMWTLLAQIPAIFLYFGISEKTLSIIISGLAGMFSFQALTLCIFALSGKKLLALLSPLFIYLTEAASVFAGSYPVYLMAIAHTYGMIGLSFAILTLVLISLRQKRLGGFFAGLAPAVHFFIGIWLLVIILISFFWERNSAIKRIKEMLPYFLLGLAITFISGLYQLVFIYDVPNISSEITAPYLSAFVSHWDIHRISLPLFSGTTLLNFLIIILSLFTLRIKAKTLSNGSIFLLKAFTVAAVMGLIAILITWIPPSFLPENLIASMPGRLLNFASFGFMAILIGLLAAQEKNIWAHICLTVLIIASTLWYVMSQTINLTAPIMLLGATATLIIIWKSKNTETQSIIKQRLMSALQLTTTGMLIWLLVRGLTHSRLLPIMTVIAIAALMLIWKSKNFAIQNVIKQRLIIVLRVMAISASILILIIDVSRMISLPQKRFASLKDWTNDEVFAKASDTPLMIATSLDLRLIQLRTRKPVLLESLDQIPYVPESAIEINKILYNIYGLNILKPPGSTPGLVSGKIVLDTNKMVWEKRTKEEWVKIGKEFKISEVLADRGWQLQLEKVASNDELVLYKIEN